jgi:hypothetical protein
MLMGSVTGGMVVVVYVIDACSEDKEIQTGGDELRGKKSDGQIQVPSIYMIAQSV